MDPDPDDLRRLLDYSLNRMKSKAIPCSRCRRFNLECDAKRPCKQCLKNGIRELCDASPDWTMACLQCKHSKVRCDRGRPCSSCVKRGRGSQCCDPPYGNTDLEERRLLKASSINVHPETPMAIPSHVDVGSDLATVTDAADQQLGSLLPLMVKMSQAGYCKTSILLMINNMGPDLRSVLSAVVEGIMKKPVGEWKVGATMNQAKSSDAVYLQNFAKMNESELALGYWTVHWRPGGLVREWIEISKGLGQLLKRNPEEILSRAASCEFELPSSDLEFLCVLLEDLYCFADITMMRFGRVCRRCPGSRLGESSLVRVLSFKNVDENKRLISSTHSMELLDVGEWDRLHQDDSSCKSIYVQLLKYLGHVSSGEELLHAHKQDMSYEGREKLKKVACFIREKFAALIKPKEMYSADS